MKKFKTLLCMVLAFGVLINGGWLFLTMLNHGTPTFEYLSALTGWFWVSVIGYFIVKAD
jgi:hypothetical protein